MENIIRTFANLLIAYGKHTAPKLPKDALVSNEETEFVITKKQFEAQKLSLNSGKFEFVGKPIDTEKVYQVEGFAEALANINELDRINITMKRNENGEPEFNVT